MKASEVAIHSVVYCDPLDRTENRMQHDVLEGREIFEIEALRFEINICYDTNFSDIAEKVAKAEATLIVCCSNNMFPLGKAEAFRKVRNAVRANRCRETGLWLISSDITGERDGMVSWGPSAVLSPTGEVVRQLRLGQPGLLTFDIPVK